jgi:hypothetical protein
VTITGPALVHVNAGAAELVLLNVPVPLPPVTDHKKPTSALLPLESMPAAERLMTPPTLTERGLAERDETAAHQFATVAVALTFTAPRLPASTLLA